MMRITQALAVFTVSLSLSLSLSLCLRADDVILESILALYALATKQKEVTGGKDTLEICEDRKAGLRMNLNLPRLKKATRRAIPRSSGRDSNRYEEGYTDVLKQSEVTFEFLDEAPDATEDEKEAEGSVGGL